MNKMICPKCKSNEIIYYVKCYAEIRAMIDYKKNKLKYFGESNYEEFLGLWCECGRCNHNWKSRKYNLFEELESKLRELNKDD